MENLYNGASITWASCHVFRYKKRLTKGPIKPVFHRLSRSIAVGFINDILNVSKLFYFVRASARWNDSRRESER